jgi:hypothetical protein
LPQRILLIYFSKWDNKAAGLASDGKADSVRGMEQIRLVIADLKATTVSTKVQHSLFTDIEKHSISNPSRYMKKITINL